MRPRCPVRPKGADERCVDAPGDEWFERRIGRRLAEAVETPALQIRDPRRELKPEQGAEGEDMVGIAAAISVVAPGRDLALVVQQPIEHMRGFAGDRRDHFGVERIWSAEQPVTENRDGFTFRAPPDTARKAA
jgi:hypothetical protein